MPVYKIMGLKKTITLDNYQRMEARMPENIELIIKAQAITKLIRLKERWIHQQILQV